MMTSANNSLLEEAVKIGQRCLGDTPVTVLGSGLSIAAGLPSMADLASSLDAAVCLDGLPDEDQDSWGRLRAALRTKDLEAALSEVSLGQALTARVIIGTWQAINDKDVHAFNQLLEDRGHLPLARLFRHLLSGHQSTISVVTTNYDRLAEYAANVANATCHTGFSQGHLCHPHSAKQTSQWRGSTVDIWKVHGSLDWFMGPHNQVIALSSARDIPTNHVPQIVTPGYDKYKKTHLEPFLTILQRAHMALEEAKSYLCIGFGFNDEHITPKLVGKLQQGRAKLLILTKRLTDTAKGILEQSRDNDFLALEKADNGTNMYSPEHPKGVLLKDVDLWELPTFLDKAINA